MCQGNDTLHLAYLFDKVSLYPNTYSKIRHFNLTMLYLLQTEDLMRHATKTLQLHIYQLIGKYFM